MGHVARSAALVATVLLAACGGTSPGSTSPGSTTASPNSDPTGLPSPASTSSVTGPALVACDLLSDEDLLDITGGTVAEKVDDAMDTVFPNHCRWTLRDAAGGMVAEITLGVLSPGGRDRYDRSYAILAWEPLQGLPADAAILDPNTGSIAAVRGDVLVDLFAIFLPPEQERALAERVLENLPAG